MTTTFNTGNPIGSTKAKDLSDNASNFDDASLLLSDTWVDRLGITRDTVNGRIKKMGFAVPVAYASGISFATNDNVKTVDEGGIIYAPLPSALPFTTTNFAADSAKFFVIQGVTEFSQINDLSIPYVFETVADYKVFNKEFPAGKFIILLDRNAEFTVVDSVIAGVDIIVSDVVSQSLKLNNTSKVSKALGNDAFTQGYTSDAEIVTGNSTFSKTNNMENIEFRINDKVTTGDGFQWYGKRLNTIIQDENTASGVMETVTTSVESKKQSGTNDNATNIVNRVNAIANKADGSSDVNLTGENYIVTSFSVDPRHTANGIEVDLKVEGGDAGFGFGQDDKQVVQCMSFVSNGSYKASYMTHGDGGATSQFRYGHTVSGCELAGFRSGMSSGVGTPKVGFLSDAASFAAFYDGFDPVAYPFLISREGSYATLPPLATFTQARATISGKSGKHRMQTTDGAGAVVNVDLEANNFGLTVQFNGSEKVTFLASGGVMVNGVQVVGQRQAAIANSGDATTNLILGALRSHGLIAT